ncbi:hypothetical protein B0H11DRAFT_1938990 [Mycena galericulata]|nr:hypothetical protein B0H11DRAFT_1938990 [Mycena galericulata]
MSQYVGLKIAPNRVVSRVELPWVDFDRVDSPEPVRRSRVEHARGGGPNVSIQSCRQTRKPNPPNSTAHVLTARAGAAAGGFHVRGQSIGLRARKLLAGARFDWSLTREREWEPRAMTAEFPPNSTVLTMANAGAGDLGGGGSGARAAAASDNASIVCADADVQLARIQRRRCALADAVLDTARNNPRPLVQPSLGESIIMGFDNNRTAAETMSSHATCEAPAVGDNGGAPSRQTTHAATKERLYAPCRVVHALSEGGDFACSTTLFNAIRNPASTPAVFFFEVRVRAWGYPQKRSHTVESLRPYSANPSRLAI